MIFENDRVRSEIYSILSKNFHIPESYLCEVNGDKPLTGKPYLLSSIDLVYLYFIVERKFKKTIKLEQTDNYAFSTINKIIDTIMFE